MHLFLAFLSAFVLTVLLVPVVSRAARSRGLVDQPSYDRWSRRPVPNVGGVAMFLPLLLIAWVSGFTGPFAAVIGSSAVMFTIGFVDDLKPFRPATKLVLQVLAATILLGLLPTVRVTGWPAVDLLLGLAWVVGITNATNLLDNIDGLAAGVAGIAGAFFLCVLVVAGRAETGPLAPTMAALVGVTTGFLLYNFHPASIFMGDGGSHLLGSFLAGASLLAMPEMGQQLAPVAAVPVVLLLIPIFDTVFVTLSRGLSGRSAFLGGRDHVSHRLVALGISERRAVVVLYLLTALGGGIALALVVMPPGAAALGWGFIGLYTALLGLVGVYLGHVHVTRGAPIESPLPSELRARYRVYEVLLDAFLVSAAYYLSFVARFHDPQFGLFLPYFTSSLPFVVGLQLAVLWLSGKYREAWGALGPAELGRLIRAPVVGVAASIIAVLYLSGFQGYSRQVFVFDAVLAPVLLVSARVVLSALDQYLRLRRSRGRLALIYGAGRGGAIAAREIIHNANLELTPIGFVDDDPRKRRARVEGLPVLGSLADIAALVDEWDGQISAVIVSMNDVSRDRLDRLSEICAARGIALRRMRLELEDVQPPARAGGVVRFPGA